MKTKVRLILMVSVVVASLGFSAYGVAMAAPSLYSGGLLQGLSLDQSARGADVTEANHPGATGALESSEGSHMQETNSSDAVEHDLQLTQASDMNGSSQRDGGESQSDGGHDSSHQSSGGGGHDGSGE